MDENLNEVKEEIILLLIGLTGWEEEKRNSPGVIVFRAWKGYQYHILDSLESKKYIHQIPGGKSLFLTEEGKRKVELLRQKYLNRPSRWHPVPQT